MDSEEKITTFWKAYLDSLPSEQRPAEDPRPESWGFGHLPEHADELGALVLQGIKTATCSLLWSYEFEGESLPQVGELSIITNGAGEPICLIETTQIDIIPFDQVGAQHAFEEGEGDRSLAYWREVHWRVFTPECRASGREPSETMPLVCERFRMLYKSQEGSK
jgi:histidinol-phosphate aminotransferase